MQLGRLLRAAASSCILLIILGSPTKGVHAESLFLAGVEMKLGMPKTAVMPALEGKYKLSQVADQDSWGIMEKDGPPYKLVGQITFKDGLLTWASKDWGSFGEDGAADFANELFSVLSNLNQEEKSAATVRATTVARQPGLTINEIELVFGSKKIAILISAGENSGRNKLSIQEILQNR